MCPPSSRPGHGCPVTGQGRKADPADAHAIVMVALRDKALRELSADPGLTVLRLLCDRRDELYRAWAQAPNRMHRLFTELVPGQGHGKVVISGAVTSPVGAVGSVR
jgi:hypothetical protein